MKKSVLFTVFIFSGYIILGQSYNSGFGHFEWGVSI
jgi:hypothetical protein